MIRPYRLLAASELQHVRERLDPALNAWSEKWWPAGVERPKVVVESWRPPERDGPTLWAHCRCGDHDLLLYVSDAPRFCALLCGTAQASGDVAPEVKAISHAVAQSVVGDFLARIPAEAPPQALAWRCETPVRDLAAFCAERTGSVRVDLCSSDGLALFSLGIPAAWCGIPLVRAPAANRVAVSSRREAIGSAVVGLEVVMTDDALTVGDIRDMRVGDTLCFASQISNPLEVLIAGGDSVGSARLGAATGRRAIRIER